MFYGSSLDIKLMYFIEFLYPTPTLLANGTDYDANIFDRAIAWNFAAGHLDKFEPFIRVPLPIGTN